MKQGRILLISILAGFGIVLADLYITRPPTPSSEITPLYDRFYVSGQVQLSDFRSTQFRHFQTVIDLRPDGEAANQPSSSQVAAECRSRELRFFYVPVPHGKIPDSAVHALKSAIENSQGETLLYCRSGKRAVRTFCLAQASLPGGGSLVDILKIATDAGQSAEDLTPDIKERIAHRLQRPENKK